MKNVYSTPCIEVFEGTEEIICAASPAGAIPEQGGWHNEGPTDDVIEGAARGDRDTDFGSLW